nr:cytochrome c [Conchiformibius kuhniae]
MACAVGTALLLGACGGGASEAAQEQNNASAPAASVVETGGASGQTFAKGKGDISKERSATFKAMMPAFSGMRKMANGDDAFDADKFKELAAAFAQDARVPFEHFQNDPNGNGRALSAVWLQPEAFAGQRDKFLEAVDALNQAAQSGKLEDIKAAFEPVGASCQSCHDAFRAEE